MSNDKFPGNYEEYRSRRENLCDGISCSEPRPDPCGACCFNAGYLAGLQSGTTAMRRRAAKGARDHCHGHIGCSGCMSAGESFAELIEELPLDLEEEAGKE